MLSYTGNVYVAKLGAKPVVAAPFSLQEAAGVPKGTTAPNTVDWFPGGSQQMALHRASGQLYVLMHMGEFWSHKAGQRSLAARHGQPQGGQAHDRARRSPP
jgi:methylamine dehydrogenase heavy chain